MRIMHIDLTGAYTDGMNYQENVLSGINVQDGHEVSFIATNYTWNNGRIEKVSEEEFFTSSGVHLIRVSYQNLLLSVLTDKLRVVKNLKKLLYAFNPEVIMLHGYHTLSVLSIIRYIKYHKNIRLFVDNHADKYNSAQTMLSNLVLHRFIYARMAKEVLKYTEKIWCVSYDAMKYAEEISKIPLQRLEYYPLGGKIFPWEEYDKKRKNIRSRYSLTEDDILLMHSGKMDVQKKTIMILQAMERVRDERLKLIIIGSMEEEVKSFYEKIGRSDRRVEYVGWKCGEELLDYLCAADLYLQPGTQSATMQNAACCRCALALYPYESHKYLLGESVFYIKNARDIVELLNEILRNPQIIRQKRDEIFAVAQEKLDYRKLAARLYI